MTDTCGAKYPTGLDRCSLDPHSNKTDHFDETTGRKWGGKKPKGNPNLGRSGIQGGRGPRQSSSKQDERTAFLHGIKAERLRQMAADGDGPSYWAYICEGGCGFVTDDFEEAWEVLTCSHIEPRNDTSTRYERRREPDFRGDDPSNVLLECVPCNLKREPQPVFSGSEEEAGRVRHDCPPGFDAGISLDGASGESRPQTKEDR